MNNLNTRPLSVAIVGATGLVGSMVLSLLEERAFPVKQLYLLASLQSAGKEQVFRGNRYQIQDLSNFDFQQSDICFFSVGDQLAAHYIPKAIEAGNWVIDKSAHFRNHPDVPLIVPEVNMAALNNYSQKKIIANPNCNTIPIAVALKPIFDAVGIKRINIATYQSVSGTGKEAVQELIDQTTQVLNNHPVQSQVYPKQIAFNVLPHIDRFHENGYTGEEMKIVWELQKIFEDKTLAINPTTVRVPVFYAHAAALHIETKDKITAEQAIKLFEYTPGIRLISGELPYPTPAQEAAGSDVVYVGRIREDISHDRGLNLWVTSDNLRKGAALNAIQIVENLMKSE